MQTTGGIWAAGRQDWRAAIWLVAALTAARLAALFASPLELYPDEAQYWLWSRTLDFGYFSKPPVIAWSVWATTALGGDGEPWVKLSAALYQAGASLAVFAIGRRLYGASAGFLACVLYALMPGVQLSAMVAATDAPLMFFLSLAVLAYATLPSVAGGRKLAVAAGLGAALGLAFLSKYAAAYLLLGIGLHLALSRTARAAWTLPAAVTAILAGGATVAPNLAWNAAHGFATVQHTAANAAWGGRDLFNAAELGDFLLSQFAVFGIVPFGALIVGGGLAARRRMRLPQADLMLLCFTAPPLLIVAIQAFVSRANANWSAAGYVGGAVLVAAWLLRWRARRWIWVALGTQAAAAAVFLTFVVSPGVADRVGMSNALKRAKGWEQTTDVILERAAIERDLSAIAVNNRFLFYALAYYGRGEDHAPVVSWLLADEAKNQAETTAPLTPAIGRRVLAVSYEGTWRAEMAADFTKISGLEIAGVQLDRKRKRRVEMFVGEGFNPRPRDPVSGRPTPP